MPLNFKHINGNEQILDGSIGTDLIADGAITAPKLAIGAITSSSLTIDSNLDFNNFEALQFRVENLDFFPPTGNPGRLIWRTDLRDLYVDTDYALNIISARYIPFQVHEVTSLTDMSVNSTVGMVPGDALLQGGVPFGDIEIVEIVDLSNLVVDSTVGVNVGDVIGQDNASTTVVSITDTTHLVVASTVGFVPDIAILSTPYVIAIITSITDSTNLVVSNTTGFAGRATANVNFGIVTVIDGTNLEVDNSTAISVGDVIQQGFTTTTVTAVIDLTHIAVVDTTGFAVGICDVLVLIDISAIPNGTTLVVSKTTGFGPGNPITQGAASTTIVSVVDGTTLTVGSTSGFVVNSAVDSTVVVDDTTLVNAGMLLTQGINSSLIVSVVDATHLAVANASPFVAGPASTGNWVAINDGGSVNSIRSDANPQLQGNITLASGTNVDLAQISQTITVNVPAAGVTGQLQFNDNVANEFGADSNLFWDNVTKRLGIGNAAPTTTLDVTGTANVSGATTLGSTLDVTDATTLNNTLDVTNATTLNNTLDVTGATTLNNTLDVVGATTLQNTLDVTDATTLNNTLDVTGLATFLNEIQMSADQRIIFNTAADTFIKYSTNHGGMVLQAGPGGNANLNFEGGIAMWANTLANGSGTYSPAFVMNNADGVNISTATGGVLIDDDLTGSGPLASAKLEVKSTTKGFLTPRMTTVQRNAIVSPATGLLIYNTTTNQEEYYNGTIWAPIGNTAVAGNNTEIQYNDNGVFGADPKFRWDATNNTILVGTAPVITNYYGLSIDDGSISLKDGTDTAGGIGLDMYNSLDTYLGGLYFYSADGSTDWLTATANAKISMIPGNNNTVKRLSVTENSVEIGTSPVINNAYGISMHADAMAVKPINTFGEVDFYDNAENFIGLIGGDASNSRMVLEGDLSGGILLDALSGNIFARTAQIFTVQPGNVGENVQFMRADGTTPAFGMDTDNSSFRLYSRDDGYGDISIHGNGTYILATSLSDGTIYRIVANNLTNMLIGTDQNIPILLTTNNGAQTWTFGTDGHLATPGDVSLPTDKKLYFDNTNVYFKRDSVFGDILVGNTAGGDSGFELATASANSAMTLYSNAGGSLGGNWAQIDLMPGANPNVRLAPGGTGFVDVTTHLISNVIDPVSAQDAATKNYVDGPAHTVAGNNTEIQFNSSGVFGASSNFRYEEVGSTNLLNIKGSVGVVPIIFLDSTDQGGEIQMRNDDGSVIFADIYGQPSGTFSVTALADIQLFTDNGNKQWIFNTNGSLNTPGNIFITQDGSQGLQITDPNGNPSLELVGDSSNFGAHIRFSASDLSTQYETVYHYASETLNILNNSVSGSAIVVTSNQTTLLGADNVGDLPDASAQVEVRSTVRGFLPPRMTTLQRDAITSPAAGLIIYNTDTNLLQTYDGVAWVTIGQALFQQDIFNITGPGNVFNLSFTPINNSQVVYYNGLALAPGVTEDYTISGNVVTLDAGIVLANGDKILVVYSHY